MPVALSDVLVDDGKYVYMKSQQFDAEGNRIDVDIPILARTMVLADDCLFVAGPADLIDETRAVPAELRRTCLKS